MSAYQSSLLQSLKKEVSEKLPQGYLDCGSKGYIVTLLFHPTKNHRIIMHLSCRFFSLFPVNTNKLSENVTSFCF